MYLQVATENINFDISLTPVIDSTSLAYTYACRIVPSFSFMHNRYINVAIPPSSSTNLCFIVGSELIILLASRTIVVLLF